MKLIPLMQSPEDNGMRSNPVLSAALKGNDMDKPRASSAPIPHLAAQPIIELMQGGDSKDICARYGITPEELSQQLQDHHRSMRNTALQDALSLQHISRNDPCPCGSGKKYKKCCQPMHEEARKNLSPEMLKEMQGRTRLKEQIEKEVHRGFHLLFGQDFKKARTLAERLLETYPEDDRVHDILLTSALATGDYEEAFRISHSRWQVAQEEKAFLQENGFHQREGRDGKNLVHFYAPSTWLENLWISQRAREHSRLYPMEMSSPLARKVARLQAANDPHRFSARQEEGFEARRQALADVLEELEKEGPAAIPYLLPLTYFFSWASLFVPDLLKASGTEEAIRLLAELSMFSFPNFSQRCLMCLETFGKRAVATVQAVLDENPLFDELKVGIIMVLGNIHTPESMDALLKVMEHENIYLVNWAAQALSNHQSPEAEPHLEKARERLQSQSKIAEAIQDLGRMVST